MIDERPEWTFHVKWQYGGMPGNEITVTSRSESLENILEAFEGFLRGSGFYLTGPLMIGEEDDT